MPFDDEDIFASAVSDEPEPTPAEPAPAPVEPSPEPESSGQVRDEHGRFAKPAEPAPEPPVAPVAPQEHGGVPPGRLREVNEQRRAAEQRAEALERRLAEVEARTRAPAQPPAAPAPKPEIWEDPDAFVRSAVDPIAQQVSSRFERMSQRMAMKEHGEEAVKGAYDALEGSLRARDPAAIAFYEQVRDSEHPYADIVDWHKRTQAVARVGNDPEAWFEAEMERRLSDPAFQSKALERIRGQAASAASGAARSSSPALNLPPSLTRAAASAPATGDDDVSDAGLFSYATR